MLGSLNMINTWTKVLFVFLFVGLVIGIALSEQSSSETSSADPEVAVTQTMEDEATEEMLVEEKIVAMLMEPQHFYLIIGILSALFMLKQWVPILFSDRWKRLVSVVNLGLSTIGVFLLGLTSATTLGRTGW